MNRNGKSWVLALWASGLLAAPLAWGDGPQIQGEKGLIYSPIGKRDPFKPSGSMGRDISAVNPLERFSVEQLQLRAVLRSVTRARAMFEDPEGKTHIVQEGDIIGRERAAVSKILNTEVILTERTFNYLGQENLYEKIVSLPEDVDEGLEVQKKDKGAAIFDPKNLQQGGGGGGAGAPPVQNAQAAPQQFNAAAAAPAPAAPAPAQAPAAPPPPADAGSNRNLINFPKR